MSLLLASFCFFFSSRRRHTRCGRDWSSDVCSSDLQAGAVVLATAYRGMDMRPDDQDCLDGLRSEERRVGKECRSRWTPPHQKKKQSEKPKAPHTICQHAWTDVEATEPQVVPQIHVR